MSKMYRRHPHRRNYRIRYYPHRRYYHIRGYRRAYYGTSFSGFLASLGVIFLIIGVIVGLDGAGNIFNPLFFIGAGLIVASIFLAILFSATMGKMRARAGDLGDPGSFDDYHQPSAPVTGTYINQPAQQAGPRRCPSCGRAAAGAFCDSCGTRL